MATAHDVKGYHWSRTLTTNRSYSMFTFNTSFFKWQWVTLKLGCLNPTKWGWERKENSLQPIKTDIDLTPAIFLKIFRCNSRTTTKNQCDGKSTYRRNGLTYLPACGECRGIMHTNRQEYSSDNDIDETDDRSIFDQFD